MSDSYVWLDKMPKNEIEMHIINLLCIIEHEIVVGYELGVFDSKKISPKEVIVMIATNIIVNFMRKASDISTEPSSIKVRLKQMEQSLDEIKAMSMKLWTTIETASADSSKSH